MSPNHVFLNFAVWKKYFGRKEEKNVCPFNWFSPTSEGCKKQRVEQIEKLCRISQPGEG